MSDIINIVKSCKGTVLIRDIQFVWAVNSQSVMMLRGCAIFTVEPLIDVNVLQAKGCSDFFCWHWSGWHVIIITNCRMLSHCTGWHASLCMLIDSEAVYTLLFWVLQICRIGCNFESLSELSKICIIAGDLQVNLPRLAASNFLSTEFSIQPVAGRSSPGYSHKCVTPSRQAFICWHARPRSSSRMSFGWANSHMKSANVDKTLLGLQVTTDLLEVCLQQRYIVRAAKWHAS